MTELTADRALRAIVDHTRRLAESAAAAGPDAAVPTAPEWAVTDLVEHVGQTQHWVAEIVERRITDPTRLPTEMAGLPADPNEWGSSVVGLPAISSACLPLVFAWACQPFPARLFMFGMSSVLRRARSPRSPRRPRRTTYCMPH